MQKLKWGILSTAAIGLKKVIPGIRKSAQNDIIAIASRNTEKAERAAGSLNISKAYDSYEKLLADPEIDAVYIPLPNHLHFPWTLKAIEAGKHVLCEKPMTLNASEAQQIHDVLNDHPEIKVMEAFMYRFHPQWIKTKELVKAGSIGKLYSINSVFSYFNDDPSNIRNKAEMGGGALMDIGCYAISLSRFLFEQEPHSIHSAMEFDDQFGVDVLTTGLLGFDDGLSTFMCSTRLHRYQRVQVFGTEGRIEIEIPFNAPPDKSTRIWLETDARREEIRFPICDQYTLQAEAFAQAIFKNCEVPIPLSDTIANMKVIDQIHEQHNR